MLETAFQPILSVENKGYFDNSWGVRRNFCLLVGFLVASAGNKRLFSKPLPSLSDLPWIKLWRLKATPSHFLQPAGASPDSSRFSSEPPQLVSLCMGGKLSLSSACLCLEKRRVLLTWARFLLSDLTLDFPKMEPGLRCVLDLPSRQTQYSVLSQGGLSLLRRELSVAAVTVRSLHQADSAGLPGAVTARDAVHK